ncbi:MAG: substrate-binding domain-containing protein, partial [Pirellulales bacterium]
MTVRCRTGSANQFFVVIFAAVVLVALLSLLLSGLGRRPGIGEAVDASGDAPANAAATDDLVVYCAAGLRPVVEKVAADYQDEYGVGVQLQYGGSNTLLNQIAVAKTGDVYIAGDESYTARAHNDGLVAETMSLAEMRPVVVVRKGNPLGIKSVDDLTRDDVVV